MQKYILKQQFEGFSVSNTDGIHKGYERFQSLLSQLEIHGAGVSTEDANQESLKNMSKAYCIIFNLQNVAFVSENTSSTNDVSTAYGVSNTSGHYSKHEQTTSSYSLLASQSSCPQLDHEDLDQVDEYDLEEMDLKWQVAMISMRIKKFFKKTGRKLQFDAKEPVGFDKTKVECYNCHKTGHFARECRTKEDNRRRDGWNPGNKDGKRTEKREESRAMVTVDGECVDWTAHTEEDENFAFMASNSSGSNTQVCSNECKESYANLKRLYDAQREQLSDASVEIKAYTQGLKKVEAQLVAHQQGQLWYEQKIKFMKIDLDDKTDVLTYHKTLLAKAQKEKDDLEVIVDKWNHSSKNLGKIINDHMPASDKFGLGTEPSELVSEPVVNQAYIEVQPKVWSDAPIIEEYESDSDDEHVCVHTEGLNTSSFANKQVKIPRENVKNQYTHSQKPKVNNKELRHGSTERGCFVDGSGVRKPTWNNVQRVNKQNQFVPLAVQTRTGINPVNTVKASGTNYVSTARQNINKQTVLSSTALKVNTVKPFVNDVRPANVFNKTHSPSSRPFKRTTVLRTKFTKQKVYAVKVKEVSTVGGKWDTAVKSSAGCKWRTPGYNNNILSKYNGGSSLRNYSTFKDPLGRLKPNRLGSLRESNHFLLNVQDNPRIKREIQQCPESTTKGVAERKNNDPLLRLQGPCLQIHFHLTLWAEAVVLLVIFRTGKLANITVPLDHFPVHSLTSKVFSFMIKKGKRFSGKVTPLFDTMLVQPTQAEDVSSERQSVEQSSPSPAPTSEVPNESLPDSTSAQSSEVPFEQQPDPSPRPTPSPSPRPSPQPSTTPIVPDSIPEPTGENLGDHSSNDTSLLGNEDDMTLPNVYDLCISLCKQVSDQAKEIIILKAKIKKLKKQAKPVIKHFKAYLKTVSLQKRLSRKSSSNKQRMHKKNVSNKEEIAKRRINNNAQNEGRTKEMVDEDKEIDKDRVNTEDGVSADDSSEGTEENIEGNEEIFEGTEEPREGTEEKGESTVGQFESTEDQPKEEISTQASQTSTQTPTSMIFGDDETIATLLLNMSKAKAVSKEKEKGVELKDVEDIDRPRPTTARSLLTLKPLPKIDPKDKGKKKIEEEDEI
ncbi:ribonuclease H-like domain-containing protein [Tanacetum coccineum]